MKVQNIIFGYVLISILLKTIRNILVMKNYIKKQIRILMILHNTKDIYVLCEHYKIYIVYGNFDLKGAFFIDENNTSFIFLRKGLSPQEEINILIHEFGHFMLHKQYLLNRRS